MWRSIYRRLQSNLQRTEAEVDEMLLSEAIGWFDCWSEVPPPGESLARITAFLGVWNPPAKPLQPSSQQELMAFAMRTQSVFGR